MSLKKIIRISAIIYITLFFSLYYACFLILLLVVRYVKPLSFSRCLVYAFLVSFFSYDGE